MSKVRLGDICNISSGGTPSRSKPEYWENGTIPWVKISDFKDKYINATEERITPLALEKSSAKLLHKGCILFSIFATLGEVSILDIDAATNQAIASLELKSDLISKDYLYCFLTSLKSQVSRMGRGVAQNNINLSILKNIEIIVPEKKIQTDITKRLETLDRMITLSNLHLIKLDELVKSRFVEMFGDPVLNIQKWIKVPMGNYMSLLTDFSANGSYEYLDSNVVMYSEPNYALMVRTTDLERSDFNKDVKYIDEKAYNILSKSKLFGNEIIMNKIGSAGKVYLMPKLNRPASLGRNAFMFRFNSDINILFLYYLLTSEYGLSEIQQHVRGAVTKTITKDAVRSIRIIVPPIELQNQFADFVAKVENQKATVQKSIDKLEMLKKSLMQEYFG